MENSFYIFSESNPKLEIERFHICSWDFRDKTSLLEFGIEIKNESIGERENFEINIYAPWITSYCSFKDFYEKLKISENSKFIFNDVATSTECYGEFDKRKGCLQKFKERIGLNFLPITFKVNDKILSIKIDLKAFQANRNSENIYLRFGVEQKRKKTFSLKKIGINKITLIYDIKINERRNLPDLILEKQPAKINTVFLFNIVPNDFNLSFFDNSIFKNIRTLEYAGFKKYLSDKRIKPNDLMVVSFKTKSKTTSYSFFNMFNNEIFSVGVLAMAVLLNLFCGILLFLPTVRNFNWNQTPMQIPWELWIASLIWSILLIYVVSKRFFPNFIKW